MLVSKHAPLHFWFLVEPAVAGGDVKSDEAKRLFWQTRDVKCDRPKPQSCQLRTPHEVCDVETRQHDSGCLSPLRK